jgi:hypothetical protein
MAISVPVQFEFGPLDRPIKSGLPEGGFFMRERYDVVVKRRLFILLSVVIWALMILPIAPLWAWLMNFVPTNRQSSLLFYFAAAALFVVPMGICGFLAWWAQRYLARWWDRLHPVGGCANCGYDLRATPDRCPECGAMPKKA